MAGEVPFRELVRYAIGGGWGTDEPTADSLPVRVIRGTDFANIASGTFDEIPRRFEVRAKVERRLLQANDIVLEISGGSRTSNQTTGRTLFVTKTILDRFEEPVIPASFCRLVRVRDDVVVPRYAYFVLQEMYKSGRAGLYEHHSTGISNFQFEYFLDQEVVWLPPLPEQRAIAHILGTLDDKIELNRRMSETLEAMARALFKAWFVDFEPVRAKLAGRWQRGQSLPGLPAELYDLFPDRLVDSELGEIPEGWKVGTLGNVAENPRRSVQPNSIPPDTPYIALEHMPRRSIALSDWGTAEGIESNKFKFRKGEILFGKLRPYFHKVGVAPVDGVCSTDIVVVCPRTPHWFAFVLCVVSSDDFVEFTNAGSTGTKMPRTSWADMARYEIALPPDALAQAFNAIVRRQVDRLIAAVHESRTLAALRDALLPKLISGEIRVKDAERFLKERGL
jgi:hypothetical protein